MFSKKASDRASENETSEARHPYKESRRIVLLNLAIWLFVFVTGLLLPETGSKGSALAGTLSGTFGALIMPKILISPAKSLIVALCGIASTLGIVAIYVKFSTFPIDMYIGRPESYFRITFIITALYTGLLMAINLVLSADELVTQRRMRGRK